MKRRPGELILFDQPVSRPVIVRADWPADFAEQFWRAYPRRVAKKVAMAALKRVRQSGEVAFTDLLAAVERYAESVAGQDPQYVAHAATWLNQWRWEDEPQHLGNTRHGQHKVSAAESWAARRLADVEDQERRNRPRLAASNDR
jgi:hypothetical protein